MCGALLSGAESASRVTVYVVVKGLGCGIGAQLSLKDVILRERGECDTGGS